MLKRNWHYLLLLFLLFDFGYSFWHYLQFPLDGDLAPVVWPSEPYTPVLNDPFGLGPLLRQERYPAPNRFFAHYFLFIYFRHVPLWLQTVLNPLDSLYAACALLKLAVHGLLVYVLAVAISNQRNVLSRGFLLAAVLVAPLFQTAGFNSQMGVIDASITYTGFYALSMSLLLLFFLPFLRAALHGEPLRVSWLGYLGLLGLTLVLGFHGTAASATGLVVCPAVLLLSWYRAFAALPATGSVLSRVRQALGLLPRPLLVVFGLFSACCVYSMYIGLFNLENDWSTLPMAQRYGRLPLGVYYQFTGKLGFPILLVLLLASAYLISRQPQTAASARVRTVLKWGGLFALAYVLLLPLGGYRAYREYILRRDSILPVTLALIGCFGLTAHYLLTHLPRPARGRYAALVGVGLAIFTFTDRYKSSQGNACERDLFARLAQSPAPIVQLPATCTMMDWQPLTDYHKSELNGWMLHYWGITNTPKLYYQQ